MRRTKRRRDYTIDDLVGIAEQLNGRVRFEIIPIEALGLKTQAVKPIPDKKKSAKAAK